MMESIDQILDTPEEFDVLEYLDNAEIAEDTVMIYTNLPSSRRLAQLMAERAQVIEERRAAERKRYQAMAAGENPEPLGLTEDIDEEDEDTIYDDEINELHAKLEKTKMVFEMVSVAPKLVRAINDSYTAKKPKDLSIEDEAKYEDKRTSDILSRAIKRVTLGNGQVDPKPWDHERLSNLEVRLYKDQAARLLNALYDMVYAGEYFERALTVDFS